MRNHTATPRIDAATWRLRVFGSGLRDPGGVELSYDQLSRLETREITAAIECAGNGRRFFGDQQGTPAPGTQWRLGAIGLARWRGVPLSAVLERAGVRPDAVDVMPEGLDNRVSADGADQGHVRRPLPIAKALDDALLAFEMNGERAPARPRLPGADRRPGLDRRRQHQVGRLDRGLLDAAELALEHQVVPRAEHPAGQERVRAAVGRPVDARAAHDRAARPLLVGRRPDPPVEVSTDGGASWQRAHVRGPNRPYGWARWTFPWRSPAPGAHQLLARATDRDGLTQPDTVPFNENGYQFWAVVRHPVRVG